MLYVPRQVCCFFRLWFSSQENVTKWSALWRVGGQIIEYQRGALLQSTSTASSGYAWSGDFSWRFLPPRVAPLGRAAVPAFMMSHPRGVGLVWMPHLATALPPDPGSRKSLLLSVYLKFISPRQPNKYTLAVWYLSLGFTWKDFL